MPYGYSQASPEGVSNVASTAKVALGTRRVDGLNEYIYAYNASTSTALVGYGVHQSGFSAGSVSISNPVNAVCYGVVKHADIDPANYGWIVTRGPAHVQIATGAAGQTTTTGQPLVLQALGLFQGITTGATGTTNTKAGKCGYCLETISSDGTGSAYIETGT